MADTLTVTDNRTGKTYELSITDGAIKATDLKKIKTADPDDAGLLTYDPACMNTAACRSEITYIDGDKGVLLYRGYPIEQLAEHSTYLETAYLILNGELPSKAALQEWTHQVTMHTMVHENIKKFMEGFTYDAHPDGSVHQHRRARCRRSTGTASRYSTPSGARCRSCDSSRRRRPSRPSHIGTALVAPTSTPTTTSASPATS